ncbi:MAG: hypothetical protein AVDCRST_MAG93-2163, partial [uncultured Chloroflexia bacterium]
ERRAVQPAPHCLFRRSGTTKRLHAAAKPIFAPLRTARHLEFTGDVSPAAYGFRLGSRQPAEHAQPGCGADGYHTARCADH